MNAETCPFIPFHPNTRCFCQINWGTPSGHKCSGALRIGLKGAHRALRHWPGLSFSFFGMRICTRIIPLRVEPWIKWMYPSPHIVDKENKTIRIHFRIRNKSWEGSFPWERCSFLLMLFTVLKEETI